MQGCRFGNARGRWGKKWQFNSELIFCFICRFWRLPCSGLKGEGSVGMSEREVSSWVFYRAAACMHDKRRTHMYVGESSLSHAHTNGSRRWRWKHVELCLGGHWARCCPPMQRGAQHTSDTPARGHWSEPGHLIKTRETNVTRTHETLFLILFMICTSQHQPFSVFAFCSDLSGDQVWLASCRVSYSRPRIKLCRILRKLPGFSLTRLISS